MRAPRRADAFIGVWLAAQLALPLHYYALREDPRDERFAWRMFSSLVEQPCQVELRVGGRGVDLRRHFADAWIAMVSLGRRQVARRMARALCDEFPGEPVALRLECPEGPPLEESDPCGGRAR